MNSKFFDLKKNKQDKMINAALKVFAENGFRHASTDEMVKLAEVSKGLLFHYFTSKIGLYEFLFDYSSKYIAMELNTTVDREETEYFAICKQIEYAKFQVMKQFPYMIYFLNKGSQETAIELKDSLELEGKKQELAELFASIYKQADYSKYEEHLEIPQLCNMVKYVLFGSMEEQVKQQCLYPDKVYKENAAYLDMLQDMFAIYSSCK